MKKKSSINIEQNYNKIYTMKDDIAFKEVFTKSGNEKILYNRKVIPKF